MHTLLAPARRSWPRRRLPAPSQADADPTSTSATPTGLRTCRSPFRPSEGHRSASISLRSTLPLVEPRHAWPQPSRTTIQTQYALPRSQHPNLRCTRRIRRSRRPHVHVPHSSRPDSLERSAVHSAKTSICTTPIPLILQPHGSYCMPALRTANPPASGTCTWSADTQPDRALLHHRLAGRVSGGCTHSALS
ncbi:hypothetical protein BV20DRAFT_968083 [Pilatotrama ljubarskyi]|nr:hypothetical protein BV20DRAFT_968083 [Pilatotrama ljubarskyi]